MSKQRRVLRYQEKYALAEQLRPRYHTALSRPTDSRADLELAARKQRIPTTNDSTQE